MTIFEKIFDLVRETWRGKSLPRILSNWVIREYCRDLKGVVLDFGGGKNPSYERYWDLRGECTRIDIDATCEPDVIADLNKPLPFPDAHADHAFLLSVLYILDDPNFSIREVCRVLKPGGMLWITSPCILPESREPHDYARYTTEGLERLMRAGGFKNLLLIPIGERFSAACHLISPLMPRFIRLVAFPIALVLDRCIPRKLKRERPAPIGYFCMAKKPESF